MKIQSLIKKTKKIKDSENCVLAYKEILKKYPGTEYKFGVFYNKNLEFNDFDIYYSHCPQGLCLGLYKKYIFNKITICINQNINYYNIVRVYNSKISIRFDKINNLSPTCVNKINNTIINMLDKFPNHQISKKSKINPQLIKILMLL